MVAEHWVHYAANITAAGNIFTFVIMMEMEPLMGSILKGFNQDKQV